MANKIKKAILVEEDFENTLEGWAFLKVLKNHNIKVYKDTFKFCTKKYKKVIEKYFILNYGVNNYKNTIPYIEKTTTKNTLLNITKLLKINICKDEKDMLKACHISCPEHLLELRKKYICEKLGISIQRYNEDEEEILNIIKEHKENRCPGPKLILDYEYFKEKHTQLEVLLNVLYYNKLYRHLMAVKLDNKYEYVVNSAYFQYTDDEYGKIQPLDPDHYNDKYLTIYPNKL